MDEINASLNSGESSVTSFCNNNRGSVSQIANKLSSSISTADTIWLQKMSRSYYDYTSS